VPTRKHSSRVNLIFLSLIIALVFFASQLILIQIFRFSYLAGLAQKQHSHTIALEPKRGTIYDRNLHPLALNVPVDSLYAKPRAMTQQQKYEAIERLAGILNVSRDFLKERLDRPKYFVWIKRKLSTPEVEKIKSFKINGLDFIQESKRYYPNQFLAAHLLGFAGTDNQGLEGLELWYDQYLKGEYGFSQILRDARQSELLIEKNFLPPRDGFNFVLTIDETIQYIAERALEKACEKHHAKSATIIVMDPKTGEILALANRPTYDLMRGSAAPPEDRLNRGVVSVYEPGSVFKIVTAAAALEEDLAREEDRFFCENGKYKVGNHILRDHHPHGILTFTQVFEQSSNIGVAKIAKRLGPRRVYEYARRFRFGIPTGVNLPGELGGNLKPPSMWSATSMAAIPMGQEVTVTALQLVCATAAVANDGLYMKPFVVKYIKDNQDEIIKEFEPVMVSEVISPQTAKRLKAILRGVVENGTGKLARIPGMTVAGKTGTAQKVVGGTYSHSKFYATFLGFAPVEDPRLAVVVVLDEPYPSYFGGTVAAPVFKEVVEDALKYLATSIAFKDKKR